MTKEAKEGVLYCRIIGIGCIIFWLIILISDPEVGIGFTFLPIFGVILLIIAGCYVAHCKEKANAPLPPLTGKAGNYYEAYRLASNIVFDTCYNRQATRSLTATSGSADLNAHTSAVVRVRKERENMGEEAPVFKSHQKPSSSQLSKAELTSWLNTNKEQDLRAFSLAISQKVRPEKICNDLAKVLKEDIDFIKNNIPSKPMCYSSSDMSRKLAKPLQEFDRRFRIVFDCNLNNTNRAETMATESALNTEARGMGFGVITSSATEAALFSAMDNHQRSRQRANAYNHTRTLMEGGLDKAFYSGVMKYYQKFSEEMQATIEDVYRSIAL